MAEAPSATDTTTTNAEATAVDTAAAATTAVAADAKPIDTAATSGADDTTGAKQPTSLLDAVRGAVEKKPDAAPPAATATKDGAEVADPAKVADSEAEDDKPPPFHEHPAWKRQLAKTAERDATINTLRPKAQAFEQMQGMVQKAGLTSPEVDAGFNIMTLMKSDPAKAYEALKPYMANLEAYLGVTLPPDLKERVDKGFVTEDDAKREARTRGEAAAATARATRTDTERAQDAQRQAGDQMTRAVSDWETAEQKSDPDFVRKQPFVAAEIHALRAQYGNPANAAQALDLVKTAKKNVDERMKGLAPAKPAVAPPVTGTSSARVNTAPKTIREAAEAGLRASKAA